MDHESYHTNRSRSRSPKGKYHINLKRIDNSVFFSDKITYESAHQLTCLLRAMESDILEDVKAAEGDMKKSKSKYIEVKIETKPINLYLTTHGGLVHAAFTIVDTIKSLKIPVHTYVSGYVASAGTLISLAGEKRFITPNSYMMIHEIRSGTWGKFSELRVEHENITKLMEHIIKYYVEHTKIACEKLMDMLRTDTDLAADACLSMGLVDTIQK
jgi:ATP-dependent Clp protease protease subunit